MNNVQMAFLLTTIAGLSTGIGGLIAYLIKKPKYKTLSVLMGFAAGVMIYVSFVELLSEAINTIGFFWGNIGFFGGIIFIFSVDKIIPHIHMDTERDTYHEEDDSEESLENQRLLESGVLTAIGIALHNFPEGMSVLAITLENPELGIPVAFAIAVHNIPEGIAVSVPIYYATKNRKKAFGFSLLSGIAEPIGAIIGYLLLLRYLTSATLNGTLAFVAGIMVFISFDELLPISREYGNEHLSNLGLFSGMVVMMISLLIL